MSRGYIHRSLGDVKETDPGGAQEYLGGYLAILTCVSMDHSYPKAPLKDTIMYLIYPMWLLRGGSQSLRENQHRHDQLPWALKENVQVTVCGILLTPMIYISEMGGMVQINWVCWWLIFLSDQQAHWTYRLRRGGGRRASQGWWQPERAEWDNETFPGPIFRLPPVTSKSNESNLQIKMRFFLLTYLKA